MYVVRYFTSDGDALIWIAFPPIAGDFTGMWNSIGGESQELNQNTNNENALGINGKCVFFIRF